MVKKEVLSHLIDQKKLAVLQVILNSQEEMYLKEIAKKSAVPITSTFRILQELAAMGMVRKKEWKTSKVYCCENNKKVEFLKELLHDEFDGIATFVERTGCMEEIQQIILHGAQKKNKANMLLIGDKIDTKAVEEVRFALNEKGFELSYVTLTPGQYEQMSKMGLYAGEKIVLKPVVKQEDAKQKK